MPPHACLALPRPSPCRLDAACRLQHRALHPQPGVRRTCDGCERQQPRQRAHHHLRWKLRRQLERADRSGCPGAARLWDASSQACWLCMYARLIVAVQPTAARCRAREHGCSKSTASCLAGSCPPSLPAPAGHGTGRQKGQGAGRLCSREAGKRMHGVVASVWCQSDSGRRSVMPPLAGMRV